MRSDSSAHGFNVNNPLVTSTFSAVFIQGCSHTCLSKAYYCKGFCAPRNAAALSNDLACTAGGTRQNANVDNSARQQRSRCNATRWDKMQSVPQSFAEETQTNETCKTDEEKSGESHRAIRGCQSVKMQISWHANVRRRMRECASSPCWMVAVISQQQEKAKQPSTSVQVK